MDIRFINSKNEIINASNLSIKVIRSSLVGIDAEKNVVQIEEYGSEEEARRWLEGSARQIWKLTELKYSDIILDLRKEEESGKSKECKEEYKNPEGDE